MRQRGRGQAAHMYARHQARSADERQWYCASIVTRLIVVTVEGARVRYHPLPQTPPLSTRQLLCVVFMIQAAARTNPLVR